MCPITHLGLPLQRVRKWGWLSLLGFSMQHHGTVSNARQAEANEVQEEARKQLGGVPNAASGFQCSGQPTGLVLAAAHSRTSCLPQLPAAVLLS